MTRRAAIFVGPSLTRADLASRKGFCWLPPAAQGDIYRIALAKPPAIGLIDGRFETIPAVWHKEILWTLRQGIRVYGAASMGALRAAELASFGMIGVGAIFEDFRSGCLEDDDEVALIHGPKELGYRSLSEAMVDIRTTLEAAQAAGIISRRTMDALLRIAKSSFFKERSWDRIFQQATRNRISKSQLSKLARWLPANRIERKRMDALAMLDTMSRDLILSPPSLRVEFDFQHTVYWQQLIDANRQ